MENKSHAIAAGAFVLTVTALLVALVVWLLRDTGEFRVFELSSRDAVTGLQPQAGVRFRGVTVGKVTAIGFDPVVTGNVLVRLSIDESAPITRSTFATLGFQGVTGLAFVQLDDSGDSKEVLATSVAHAARIPIRPSLLSKLSDQGTTILAQLEETSRRVNLLLAPDNQKALMGALQGLGAAAGGVQQLTGNMNSIFSQQFGEGRMNLPQLATDATAAFKALQSNSDKAGDSADEFKKTAGEMTQLAQRLNRNGGVIDQLGESAAALAAAGQSLNTGTLPRLNRTTDEAARTARQVSRVMDTVKDNPQALIFGNGTVPPGPGEPGFAAPTGKP
jgi:phospholipid/cholesterol/gamma-HCH transport system substrate-binding protein